MKHQPALLFDDLYREPLAAPEARARSTDPSSSHAAAGRMNASGATENHADRILHVVKQGGGWTAYEIAQATGLTNVQVSRRLSNMPAIRLADDTLARKCRVCGKRLATYWLRATFEDTDEE